MLYAQIIDQFIDTHHLLRIKFHIYIYIIISNM